MKKVILLILALFAVACSGQTEGERLIGVGGDVGRPFDPSQPVEVDGIYRVSVDFELLDSGEAWSYDSYEPNAVAIIDIRGFQRWIPTCEESFRCSGEFQLDISGSDLILGQVDIIFFDYDDVEQPYRAGIYEIPSTELYIEGYDVNVGAFERLSDFSYSIRKVGHE